MLISLLIGTMNRPDYLAYCLESLQKQTYREFEVIIVDQSKNDETSNMVKSIKWNKIIYEKVDFVGLSKARNEAIKLSSGQLFCLIDDDAYYERDYLENVVKHIGYDGSVIISGVLFNAKTGNEFVDYSKIRDGLQLTYRQVIRYCPSPAISFSSELLQTVGLFDESFGVGAKYGAAEGCFREGKHDAAGCPCGGSSADCR